MSNSELIHPSAVIADDVQLGAGVRVGPFSVVEEGVVIGANAEISSHCAIRRDTRIGEDSRIFSFSSIGDEPQDKKYAGEATRVEIGARNVIREYCTINRGTAQDEGVTRLGDDNLLMAYTHVAHDCHLGNNIIMANGASLAGHVELGDYVMLSGFAGVHQFCRVGAHSFLGAFCGIGKDVPPYILAFGMPAEPRGINAEGLRRRNFTSAQIRNLKEAYKILYRSGLRFTDAQQQLIELASEQPELKILVDFLGSSERGIFR